jgi:uncharacterized membrane protein YqjE
MNSQWSDRKRKIVAFIAVNFGMLGGFILAALLVPRETRLTTFVGICAACFVLGNVALGMKLRKAIAPNTEFNSKRAWLIIGLSIVVLILQFLWR